MTVPPDYSVGLLRRGLDVKQGLETAIRPIAVTHIPSAVVFPLVGYASEFLTVILRCASTFFLFGCVVIILIEELLGAEVPTDELI